MTDLIGPLVDRGRALAESLMEATCRIEDIGEVITTQDGEDTESTSTVYEGMCRIKPLTSRGEGGDEPGPAPAGDWQYTVSLPVDSSSGVAYGQRLTVLTSPRDPSLVDVRMQVRTAERGSQISARRMRCAEVSR